MNNTYHYEGPVELGSIVAHQCGAVGLFSNKENPDFMIHVTSIDTADHIDAVEVKVFCHTDVQSQLHCVDADVQSDTYKGYVLVCSLSGKDTVEGRKVISRQLLMQLRLLLGTTESLWGTLVGVRPTKLTHKLWDSLGSLDLVRDELETTHGISPRKWKLLETVVKQERLYVEQATVSPKEVSMYSGIPFCETHCTYCSFPYGLIQGYGKVQEFVSAYLQDIANMNECIAYHGLGVQSLYMGGGTPTSLGDGDFHRVLHALQKLIPTGHEFTVEAGRPDSLSHSKITSMIEAGVTRISLNPQTMQDDILRIIGRGHTVQDILTMYEYIVSFMDCSINMDFIAGLPRQTLQDMEENVKYIDQLRPHNVTIHTLALKKGSPLYASSYAQEIPSEHLVQHMLDSTHEALLGMGYIPYYMYRQQYMVGQMENIGYTLPHYESIYNIQMIEERQSILSIGPGSVSKWIGGQDFRQKKQYMPKDVDTYIQDMNRLLEKRNTLSKEHWRDS